MRLITLSFLLLFLLPKAKSQDFYNVKYTGSDGIKYDCLLIEDSRRDINIRIRFLHKKKNYLVEIKYRSSPIVTNTGNKKFLHFKAESMYGSSISFLSNESMPGYIAPCFIFYPDKGKIGKLNPLFTTTDYNNFSNQKKVEVCEQVSMQEVRNGRLKPYYTDGDKAYEEITAMAALNLKAAEELIPLKGMPTLHFIMVANTADKKIGVSCAKDLENLEKELKGVATATGIMYKPYIVDATDEKKFSKTTLVSKLNSVKAAPDDIIIFSYSGHGARWDDQKDDYPFMEMWVTTPFSLEPKTNAEYEIIKRIVQQNSIGLSEVHALLNKKGARLNIVLGDMCNTTLGAPRPVNLENILSFGNALRSGTEIIRRDPVKLRKLFIETSGNLISNAAKPLEKASGNSTAGGYYTASFVEALRLAGTYNQPASSWEEIIDKTIEQALMYRKNATPKELQNGIRNVVIKE